MARPPSHVLVHQQLKDLILTQQKAHNESISNMSVSMSSDFVPRIQYESAMRQLEQERIDHANTKQKLMALEDKLEFTKGEVEVLSKQLAREKEQFDKTFGVLKNKAIKETNKKIELEGKVTVTKQQCRVQEDKIEGKNREIKQLGDKLKKQDVQYQKQLNEIRVKLEQEMYIAKHMKEDKRTGNKRRSHLTTTSGGLNLRDVGYKR